MKVNYSSKVGGYILALFLILGFTAIASSTAQAQWGRERDDRYRRDRDYRDDRYRDDRYRDNRYRRNSYETAQQQGYSYGMSVGAADAQRNQSYNPQRSRYWKNATEGYNSSYGSNKGQYKQVFRSAFEQGYRDGWQRFAGYGRRDRWGRTRY
jgi:hypothetical protein